MISSAKWLVWLLLAPVVIVVAAPILLWLGRPVAETRGEFVVDEDLFDISEDERTP